MIHLKLDAKNTTTTHSPNNKGKRNTSIQKQTKIQTMGKSVTTPYGPLNIVLAPPHSLSHGITVLHPNFIALRYQTNTATPDFFFIYF